MSLPILAIVGRPNVGKSSLLNALSGRRIAIVDPTPGVTRDRIAVPMALSNDPDRPCYVELVDTGGMGIEDVDQLTEHVEAQIAYAVAEAELILFLVDAREGITPLDREVARRLRKHNKPVVLVANKVDQEKIIGEIGELAGLGFGEPMIVSAKHHRGLADLTDLLASHMVDRGEDRLEETVMKLAVVGKRNAGKSTFINALAGQERVIVSETPGTTRDSVDVTIDLDGRTFTLIDTAGLHRHRRLDGDIQFYSRHRALRSIRRADVVAMLIDASLPISQVDKQLAGEIAEHLKPVVLVVNKWDLAREQARGEDYVEYFAKSFPELAFAPISLTTATAGENIRETIDLAEDMFGQATTRMGTSELNTAIEEIVALRGPSHKAGTKPPRIYYASQVAVAPPTIVCFVNDPRSFSTNYERFLINQLRERVPFPEVPIRVIFRSHREKDGDDERSRRR